MHKLTFQWPALMSTLTIGVSFAIVFVSDYFHAPAGRRHVAEGAFIEDASAWLWVVAAGLAVMVALRRRDIRWDLLLIGYAFLICACRELDFHTRFTPWNMGHPIKYTQDYILLSLRLSVIALVIAPLLTVYVLIATRWRRMFRRAWSEGRLWSRGILWWMAFLIVARIADKLSGDWSEWYPASNSAWLFRAAEESVELGLALLTVLLVAPHAFTPPRRQGAPLRSHALPAP